MSSDTVGRPMEVLLVEDSLTAARLTMGALLRGPVQHRMTWISDGGEAWDYLAREGRFALAPRPDLILLDLGLPTLDGHEVLRRIRSDADLGSVPVVVMTASSDDADRAASEHLRVQGYLTKPLDLPAFLELVRQLSRYWREDMILPPEARRTPFPATTDA